MNVSSIRQPYVVSHEEKQAFVAASKGKYKEAVVLYDRAILANPSRVIRIAEQCLDSSPKIFSKYVPMASAFYEKDEACAKSCLGAMIRRSSIPPVDLDALTKNMFLPSYTDSWKEPGLEASGSNSLEISQRWSDGSSVAHEQQRLDEKKNQ